MLVVADTSPFVGLIKIGHIEVLPALFGRVLVPPEVARELGASERPTEVRQFVGTPPNWLVIQAPRTIEGMESLDAGERAAICLARELGADALLIDETKGRAEAMAQGITTIRTATILYQAALAGLLDLRVAYANLQATNFRVPVTVLDALLAQFENLRRGK